MTKMKISVLHDFDPATHGTKEDRAGWFIKKDDVQIARIPHPYRVGKDFYFPPTDYTVVQGREVAP